MEGVRGACSPRNMEQHTGGGGGLWFVVCGLMISNIHGRHMRFHVDDVGVQRMEVTDGTLRLGRPRVVTLMQRTTPGAPSRVTFGVHQGSN